MLQQQHFISGSLFFFWLTVVASPSAETAKTRVVHTKYGSLQGFIRPLGHLLGDVEVFLGIPYASAPVEDGRFTPTNSPAPWEGIRDATRQPPVCPQLLSDVDNSMTYERASYLRKIRPFLNNQSEDCLTLSIYSPILVIPGSEVYPVVVYLHGESFSWGAGSLYDGSVLAAYGRVVVVTINYRLGPLGFLNSYPGAGSPGVASNFAILDQIAALSWLADSIGHFHGDRNKVTLVGRDTGAACITYLMDSPVMPPGLFHRAVLLSGGSWCPWARVAAPLSNTIKLALTLDCPVPDDSSINTAAWKKCLVFVDVSEEENDCVAHKVVSLLSDMGAVTRNAQYPPTVACLRRVPLSMLMAAARTIVGPTFTPTWGPSEDGVVVAQDIRGKQSRDLVFGFTPWEGWSWLPPELHNGLDNATFTRVVRTLVRNTRRHHLRAVLAAALQEYTDWSAPASSDLKRRDLLLQLLGDVMLASPLHYAADAYSTHRKVFVFMTDVTAHLKQQLPGWELGLLWGAGLSEGDVGLSASPPLPGPVLAQLSEHLITLITNFAKSGDPNMPRESPSPGFAAIGWPAYQPDTRRFLIISVPPSVGSQYRAHQFALWSWLVPELEAVGGGGPFSATNHSWEVSDNPSLFYGSVRPVDPWAFMNSQNQNKTEAVASGVAAASTDDPSLPDKSSQLTTTLALSPTHSSPSAEGLFPVHHNFMKYSPALLATLGLGLSLLLLNAIVFGLVIWRRPKGAQQKKLTTQQQHPQLQSVSGGLTQDGSILNMIDMGTLSDGTRVAGRTQHPCSEQTMSHISCSSHTQLRYAPLRKNNFNKKRGHASLGVLPEHASSSCDKLCHDSYWPSTFRREVSSPGAASLQYGRQSPVPSLQSASEQHSEPLTAPVVLMPLRRDRTGSPASSVQSSGCEHDEQQDLPRHPSVSRSLNPAHRSIERRQSIPCLMNREPHALTQSTNYQTLPRQTTDKPKTKGSCVDAHQARESYSKSLFDISDAALKEDLRCKQRQVHPRDGDQRSCEPNAKENEGNYDSKHGEKADRQPRQYPQSILHQNSANRNIKRTLHKQLDNKFSHQNKANSARRHQLQPEDTRDCDSLDQITTFSVLNSCPPEFQNDRSSVALSDHPPPPRVTGHGFQQRRQDKPESKEVRFDSSITSSGSLVTFSSPSLYKNQCQGSTSADPSSITQHNLLPSAKSQNIDHSHQRLNTKQYQMVDSLQENGHNHPHGRNQHQYIRFGVQQHPLVSSSIETNCPTDCGSSQPNCSSNESSSTSHESKSTSHPGTSSSGSHHQTSCSSPRTSCSSHHHSSEEPSSLQPRSPHPTNVNEQHRTANQPPSSQYLARDRHTEKRVTIVEEGIHRL